MTVYFFCKDFIDHPEAYTTYVDLRAPNPLFVSDLDDSLWFQDQARFIHQRVTLINDYWQTTDTTGKALAHQALTELTSWLADNAPDTPVLKPMLSLWLAVRLDPQLIQSAANHMPLTPEMVIRLGFPENTPWRLGDPISDDDLKRLIAKELETKLQHLAWLLSVTIDDLDPLHANLAAGLAADGSLLADDKQKAVAPLRNGAALNAAAPTKREVRRANLIICQSAGENIDPEEAEEFSDEAPWDTQTALSYLSRGAGRSESFSWTSLEKLMAQKPELIFAWMASAWEDPSIHHPPYVFEYLLVNRLLNAVLNVPALREFYNPYAAQWQNHPDDRVRAFATMILTYSPLPTRAMPSPINEALIPTITQFPTWNNNEIAQFFEAQLFKDLDNLRPLSPWQWQSILDHIGLYVDAHSELGVDPDFREGLGADRMHEQPNFYFAAWDQLIRLSRNHPTVLAAYATHVRALSTPLLGQPFRLGDIHTQLDSILFINGMPLRLLEETMYPGYGHYQSLVGFVNPNNGETFASVLRAHHQQWQEWGVSPRDGTRFLFQLLTAFKAGRSWFADDRGIVYRFKNIQKNAGFQPSPFRDTSTGGRGVFEITRLDREGQANSTLTIPDLVIYMLYFYGFGEGTVQDPEYPAPYGVSPQQLRDFTAP